MGFKIDFDKLREEHWSSLPPEEQKWRIQYRQLKKDNTFYKSTTKTVIIKNGITHEGYNREVRLYRRVQASESLTVENRLVLSFGGYCEYTFDKRLIRRLDESVLLNGLTFCIDAGRNEYITSLEISRIFNECLNLLYEHNLVLVDDYSPNFTNSDMGKMLQGMGLL